MKQIMFCLMLLVGFVLNCVFSTRADDVVGALPNPGFEEQKSGWSWGNPEVTLMADAAHSGTTGMRINVVDTLPTGTSVYSSGLPVKPGQRITLSYFSRSKDKPFCGVYAYFRDTKGKNISSGKGGGKTVSMPNKSDGEWHEYKLDMNAPEGAESVILWIHTWGGAKGIVEFDDFAISGIDAGVKPIAPPVARAVKKLVVPDISELPPRKAPPVIVIKLDDLKPIRGNVHGRWIVVDEYLSKKNIKYTAGVICEDIGSASPEFVKWMQERQKSGKVEFWFHGWDHKTYKAADGNSYSEFGGRGYEEQHKRFEESQKLVVDKLGFNFATFGPPGGGKRHFDADTCKAMADDPHMKVWLYCQPLDKLGKELAAAGKITILDRVWAVNIEGGVGVPDYNRFLAGYAKNPDREYFVLQGHPMPWGDERLAEFKKIIEFLESQNAVFVTPSEYAVELSQGKPE